MERFYGWFILPIEKLKELPEGDGGFLALSAALFLCERYYRALTNTLHEKGIRDDETFKIEAAKEINELLNNIVRLGSFRLKYRIAVDPPADPGSEWDRPAILVDFSGPDVDLLTERDAELLGLTPLAMRAR